MADFVQKIAYHGTQHKPGAPTLALKDVSVLYATIGEARASHYALQNITLQVEAGEQVAIVGPNGAGKSTLLKLVAGVLKPDQGEVTMYGQSPEKHICIAYVPQRNQIDWTFPATVEDVVMMGRVRQIGLFRRPSRRDWEFVHAALARVNAQALARKQIGELSGGQQQRVFIARALAQEVDLLLLDEPLTGLDVPSQEAIFEILGSLRPDGVTLLVATHDLYLAAERFDRVLMLNTRVVAFGKGPAVLSKENLLSAYGGHVHVINNAEVMLTDDCCDHGEEGEEWTGS